MTSRRARAYRSLYFRIGFSFVVFVVGVVVAQSAIFSYVLARSNPFPNRSPNNLAAIVAADVGSQLAEDPDLDLEDYLAKEYGRIRFPVFVVTKDGRAAANVSATNLPPTMRRSVDAMLSGVDVRRSGREALLEGGAPIVMAPIQVAGELRGMVVMPPPNGAASPVIRDVSRLLSFPGNLLLIVATIMVAAIVFEPARRRLKALEQATERLGAGDLATRASEHGGDEIARVAGAFNRMASDLAARDDALRMSDRLRRQMLADISHELKTPLTTMRGYIETLRMEGMSTDPAARQRYLATIERETLRLDRIVKDLLDLARLEQGGVTLDVRLFAIRRVFDRVIARHEPAGTHRLHDHAAADARRQRLLDVSELVADSPRRQDQLWILRVALDLLSQSADDGIDRPLRDVLVAAPNLREQGHAAEDDAGPRCQQLEQIEFLPCEIHGVAVRDDLTLVDIDREISEGEMTRRWRLGGPIRACRAPQQSADARHQLAHAERLGQVVVGAAFEAEHFVRLGVPGGEHQKRRTDVRALGACGTAKGDAVDARQHDVEHDEIEWARPDDIQRGPSVGDFRHVEAHELQVQAQQLADRRLVFDDQHVSTRRHVRRSRSTVRSGTRARRRAPPAWRPTRTACP